MTAIDIAAYMPLDYVARIGKALADAGVARMDAWAQAAKRVPIGGEPAICRLQEGVWALELWHTADLGLSHAARPIAKAYAEETGQVIDDAYLYLGDILSAYCDLIESGDWATGTICNVVVSRRHAAYDGAVLALAMGAPLYTVVGEDAAGSTQNMGTLPPPRCLAGRITEAEWALIRANVLPAEADPDEVKDAIADLLDDEGYLLHPVSASAYRVARIYREEAESRNPVLVVAPFHPYAAAEPLSALLCDKRGKTAEQAMRLLELETGWEIPPQLTDNDVAQAIAEKIRNHYGEEL